MAGRRMPGPAIDQLRHFLGANILSLPTPGAEPAPRGRVGRARHIALQEDAAVRVPLRRIFDMAPGNSGLLEH